MVSWRQPVLFVIIWLVTALVLFMGSRKELGALPALMALGIGTGLGTLISLALIFWPLLEGHGLDRVDRVAAFSIIELPFAQILTIGGMCASWLSLALFGPFVMPRRPPS